MSGRNRLSGREVRRVLARGSRVSGTLLEVYLLSMEGSAWKVGVVVPGRIGSAVARNRVKRRLRTVVSAGRDRWPTGVWVAVRPRAGAEVAKFQKLEVEFWGIVREFASTTDAPDG